MKNVKFYLFIVIAIGMSSCSEGDLNGKSGTDPAIEELVSSNFIPTIESWNSLPHSAVEWDHEFNNEGKLVKSIMFEKYPRRILWELTYLNHNENQLPLEYKKTYFSFGEQVNMFTWDIRYTEDGTIEALTAFKDGSYSHEYSFPVLDEKNRVKSSLYFDTTGEFIYRTAYEYGQDGNHKRVTRLGSEFGSGDMLEKWDYNYNNFGDREYTQYINMETGSTTEFTHFYREDFTLKSTESISNSEGSPEIIYITDFDEEERTIYQIVTYGEQKWEYFSYFPNGDVEILEYYFGDELIWVQTYHEDRTSVRKIFNYENGTYMVEYRDSEGTVFKVEFYDSNDNLLNTEYYSRSTRFNKQLKLSQINDNLHFENLGGENLKK